MANGHIEIHDPLLNHNDLSVSPDLKSTSDTTSMEDTVEYRILMAYAKRRRPKQDTSPRGSQVGLNGSVANGTKKETNEEEEEEKPKKKKKKKKGLKGLLNIFKCVKPQTDEAEEPQQTPDDDDDYNVSSRAFVGGDETEENEDELGDVAERLTEIAGEIQFIPQPDTESSIEPPLGTDSGIEADSPPSLTEPDDVEKLIGLILRESGDSLNERELKNANIAMELFWNYGFFQKLMSGVLTRMGLKSPNPDSPGPKASPKTQMAVMCEVTSRLSAVNTLPMNRLLDHGARYLQDYYSTWVEQQGGYEAAFKEDEDEVQ